MSMIEQNINKSILTYYFYHGRVPQGAHSKNIQSIQTCLCNPTRNSIGEQINTVIAEVVRNNLSCSLLQVAKNAKN